MENRPNVQNCGVQALIHIRIPGHWRAGYTLESPESEQKHIHRNPFNSCGVYGIVHMIRSALQNTSENTQECEACFVSICTSQNEHSAEQGLLMT